MNFYTHKYTHIKLHHSKLGKNPYKAPYKYQSSIDIHTYLLLNVVFFTFSENFLFFFYNKLKY